MAEARPTLPSRGAAVPGCSAGETAEMQNLFRDEVEKHALRYFCNENPKRMNGSNDYEKVC